MYWICEEITVYFMRKIREEKKFQNAEALIRQITRDIGTARDFLLKADELIS